MKQQRKVAENGARLRVFLVEDHPVVRRGICAVLAKRAEVEVVGECGDGEEALEGIRALRPDVVLMDVDLPGRSGLDVAEALKDEACAVRVILLSAYQQGEMLRRAAAAGVWRFLPKDSPVEDVARAVVEVAGPGAVRKVELGTGARKHPSLEKLTEREKKVLVLVASGFGSEEIARRLGMSESVVSSHRAALMRKLEARSVADLTRFAVAAGLVQAEGWLGQEDWL
jgi:DNA-binding NarL/FixJ family response regulator